MRGEVGTERGKAWQQVKGTHPEVFRSGRDHPSAVQRISGSGPRPKEASKTEQQPRPSPRASGPAGAAFPFWFCDNWGFGKAR